MPMEIDDFKKGYSQTDKYNEDMSSILKFVIFENFGEKVGAFYSMIDNNDEFSKILDAFGGMTITFPTLEEFKSATMLFFVFYYKEVLHFSWKKIGELLPYEKDISLRYGAKIKGLSKSIKKYIMKNKDNMKDEDLLS